MCVETSGSVWVEYDETVLLSLAVLVASAGAHRAGDADDDLVIQILEGCGFRADDWSEGTGNGNLVCADLDNMAWTKQNEHAITLLAQAGAHLSGNFRNNEEAWCYRMRDGRMVTDTIVEVPSEEELEMRAAWEAWQSLHAAAADDTVTDAQIRAMAVTPLAGFVPA